MHGVAQPTASPSLQVRKLGLRSHNEEMAIPAPENSMSYLFPGPCGADGPGELASIAAEVGLGLRLHPGWTDPSSCFNQPCDPGRVTLILPTSVSRLLSYFSVFKALSFS